MAFAENLKSLVDNDTQELIIAILQNQFRYFYSEVEMQRIILWEISAESLLMKSTPMVPESLGQQFLQMTDPHFNGTDINFRAIAGHLKTNRC